MPRTLLVLSTAALVLAAAGSYLAFASLSGRTREPSERLAAARDALRHARSTASDWADEELSVAEHLYLEAQRRYRREAVRPFPRRDYTPIASELWRAERASWAAANAAAERRESARADAEDAMVEAHDLLEHARAIAATTALPERSQRWLAEARLAVGEGQLLFEQGAYPQARERALAARDSLFAGLGGVLEVARRYTADEQLETWARWIEQTRQWSRRSGRLAVIVYKEKNRLQVLSQGEPVLDYPVDVGANGIGPKLQQGDRATPEGRYRIVLKKGPGQSLYHKALLLDYPNAEDRRRTAEAGRDGRLRRGADPGGLIEIHGDGGRGRNWTDGCVAVSNADMDVLYERLEVGAWVTIVGGDGRDGAFSSLVARLDARREVGR
jgi:hypothetical protein